jgi:Gly-Xaa carboxypeptidase
MQIIISSCSTQADANPGTPCSEQPVLHPHARPDITSFNTSLFTSPSFTDLVAQRLAGAVKIPCVTYDGMDKVGEDPRWEIFYSFTKYLRETFPVL